MKKASKKANQAPVLAYIEQVKEADACINNPEKYKEGIELYQKALILITKTDKTAIARKKHCLLRIAYLYYQLKEYGNAITYLERYNNEFPNEFEVLDKLFMSYLNLEDITNAHKYLKKVKKLNLANTEIARLYLNVLIFTEQKCNYNNIIQNDAKHKEMLAFALEHGQPQAQILYDKFVITQLLGAAQYAESYKLALTYCRNENLNPKLYGIFICGLSKHKLGDLKVAISWYEKYIALFKENYQYVLSSYNDETTRTKELIRYCYSWHGLSRIYSGDDGSSFSDTEKEMHCLTVSADLGDAGSHHDLGYIYETGENGTVDLDKAIMHYTRSIQLGNQDSSLNLGIALEERNSPGDRDQALIYFERALELTNPNLKMKTYMHIGGHYIRIAYAYRDANNNEQAQAYAKLCYDKVLLAYEMQCGRAAIVIACLYLEGMSVEKNLKQALHFMQQAEVYGEEADSHDMIGIYMELFNQENDVEKRSEYVQAVSKLIGEGAAAVIEFFSQILHQQSKNTNKQITIVANDRSQDYIKRIDALLNYQLDNMNTINVSTLLQKLGNLIENSLNHRRVHQNNLLRIIPLIENAYQRLLESRFQGTYYVMLIQGLSKLYLTVEIESYKKLVEGLYKKANTEIDKLTPSLINTLLLAATRLDPGFKGYIALNPLIKKNLENVGSLDDQQLAIFTYATMVLSIKSGFAVSTVRFKPLIVAANAALSKPFNFIDTKQLCQALNYCVYNKIFPASINKELLDSTTAKLQPYINDTHRSGLQNEIINYLSVFFQKISEEKVIGVYPVDALIEVDDKPKFILQVDGPSHFLHGLTTMRPHSRTLFRDAYLSNLYPVIVITYTEWNALKNNFLEIKKFFAERLSGISVALPPPLVGNRPKNIFGFFNDSRPQSPQTAPPVGGAITPRLGSRTS